MEKNEHAIFLDIPSGGKNGKFHSAILATYAIDLIHFDNQLLNLLHRKQVCSINIFADTHQMDKSMEYVKPIFLKSIGMDYSITSMDAVGAFHPKINFFVGDKSVMVVFGTGNLTVTGHGKNHESFTGFMIDETNDSHKPIIEECWQYLRSFTNQCTKFDRNRILHEIPDNCSLLEASYKIIPHKMWTVHNGMQAALLYNESKSGILQQISTLVPLMDVEIVTVLSPYFDENGETLSTLARLCPKAKINVLIQKSCVLPPSKLPMNKNIVFYDFNETKRGKNEFKTYDRQLHSKIIHFKTHDSEYCVIGSANATIAGLGTMTQRGINEEFCVLYHSKEKDFLTSLGLKTKKKLNIPVRNIKRLEDNDSSLNLSKLRIMSAQYENGIIYIILNKTLPTGTLLALDNGIEVLESKLTPVNKCQYQTDIKLDKKQFICYLLDKKKSQTSNKVHIQWTEILASTNPSKMSRELNRFISKIEDEGYEGMEVIDLLSDVMWDLFNESERNNKPQIKGASEKRIVSSNSLPTIKYNPEYDNDDAKSRTVIQIDKTSKLIECIEESILKKIHSLEDAIIDEEENGSAETSNDRDIEEIEDIIISKKNIKDQGELTTSLLKKYMIMISKRFEHVSITKEDIISKDDLNFFSITMFAAMEICYLNRFRYQFDEKDPIIRSKYQKQLYESLDRSIRNLGIDAFESFANFCMSMKGHIPQDDNYNKISKRAMKYAILFEALFYKFSSKIEKKIRGKRLLSAARNLISIFGAPSIDYLTQELQPLSERYDYIFRMKDIEKMAECYSKHP